MRGHTIEMSPNATVGEMKPEIETKSGIPVNNQRSFRSYGVPPQVCTMTRENSALITKLSIWPFEGTNNFHFK